jgi:hypothetical protein
VNLPFNKLEAAAKAPEIQQKRLAFEAKIEFSGDFQGPNLTMREKLTAKSFAQALIPNGLQIICKVLREIYTPWWRGWGTSLVSGVEPAG